MLYKRRYRQYTNNVVIKKNRKYVVKVFVGGIKIFFKIYFPSHILLFPFKFGDKTEPKFVITFFFDLYFRRHTRYQLKDGIEFYCHFWYKVLIFISVYCQQFCCRSDKLNWTIIIIIFNDIFFIIWRPLKQDKRLNSLLEYWGRHKFFTHLQNLSISIAIIGLLVS